MPRRVYWCITGTDGLRAACFVGRTISRGKLQALFFFFCELFFFFLMVMLISGAALAVPQSKAGLAPETQ